MSGRTQTVGLLAATGVVVVVAGVSRASLPIATDDAAQEPGYVVDTTWIRTITQVLSHDSLLGRPTASPGADLAAAYIESLCREIGLQPVGDRYLHPVPLARAHLSPDGTRLTVRGGSGGWERSFTSPASFLPTGALSVNLHGFQGPAVFVGSGPDIINGPSGPVAGRVAVTVDALLAAPAADSLRARGAVGIVSLITDDDARSYVEWFRGPAPLHLSDSIESSFFPALPTVAAWPDVAEAISSMATIGSGATVPLDLHLEIEVQVAFHPEPAGAHNVACLLPGSDAGASDRAIALTAHYDHLGIWEPDETGDSIYNGFSDNAAGVAMLLAIADAVAARQDPLRHSLLLVFPTGEEKGLLGSDYFVARPPWPLDRLLGVINIDAGAPPAPPRSWRIAGGDSSALGALARDVAAVQGWSATTSAATPNSDYFPFWRRGVPAIFIIPGSGPYEGLSADSSQALRDRWDRYHQPGDEWFEDFPFAGVGRYAEFALRVADALDRAKLEPRD